MTSTTESSNANTRERLMDAAGELFAASGFRDVTVRQICQKAQANIAAVNYHFRDKESLYREVVLSAYRSARERYPLNVGVTDSDPAEKRLRAFVRGILGRIFDESNPPWGRLLAREMVDPTHALDGVVEEGMRPQYALLSSIVKQAAGTGLTEAQVARLCEAIVGQVLVYHTCRVVMQKVTPGGAPGREQIDELSDHIVAFSMGAIRAVTAPPGGKR